MTAKAVAVVHAEPAAGVLLVAGHSGACVRLNRAKREAKLQLLL